MPDFTPRLEIYPQRVISNAQHILDLCHSHNIQVACVTKVTCAHPEVVKALEFSGADMLADSRLENLSAIREIGTQLPLMLLRIPTPSRVDESVRVSDLSLVSDVKTIQLLSDAAASLHVKHKVILMVDLGDLREGIWPDRVTEVLKKIASLPGLDVIGLGCNLACYGGVVPTAEKMLKLVSIRDENCRILGLELPVLCGGNSANLPMLLRGEMPGEINLLRIGETIMLGRNVLDRSFFPGTRQDAFRVIAEVVEIERKPSIPIGERGQDAFGGVPEFIDRGTRKRAICNIGRQDVVIDNLQPVDPGIIVLGGSSDHLLLDVEEAGWQVRTGDEIAFYPGYAALLAASTSQYLKKVVLPDE
jgi:predicted amino acid racemase